MEPPFLRHHLSCFALSRVQLAAAPGYGGSSCPTADGDRATPHRDRSCAPRGRSLLDHGGCEQRGLADLGRYAHDAGARRGPGAERWEEEEDTAIATPPPGAGGGGRSTEATTTLGWAAMLP